MFTHIVVFWLKDNSLTNIQQFKNGLQTLGKIKFIRGFHIGCPAQTPPRSVVDTSYSIMLTTIFDNMKDYNNYAPHPIHNKFIKNYSSYWQKVVVFDAQ